MVHETNKGRLTNKDREIALDALLDSKKKQSSGRLNKAELKLLKDNMPNKKMSPGEIKARIGSSIVARKAAVAGKEENPTTVEEALADGWTMSKGMGMSDPPVMRFTKDGKSISIRGEKSGKIPGLLSPLMKQKGGAVRKGDAEAVQMYKHGGEVKSKKSKLAGRLAMRGYGKARK
mgnify:CR=1 FL=1